MNLFARPLSPADLSTVAARRLLLTAAIALTLAAALVLAPARAGAYVAHIGPISVGQQPRLVNVEEEKHLAPGLPTYLPLEYEETKLPPTAPYTFANGEGNPVLHGTNTWAIFWDPLNDYYHGDWEELIEKYFKRAAEASGSLGSIYSVDAQYTDKSNRPASYQQSYRGGQVDTHAYPTSGCTDPAPLPKGERETKKVPPTTCLTSEQVADELEWFITQHALPRGMNNVYYLLTPPGVTVCLDAGGASGHCSDFAATTESYDNSFCSYHADINPGNPKEGGPGTILYGVIPWSAGEFKDPDYFLEQKPGWECQDGGFNPASKPAEEKEKRKKKSESEEKAFKEKNEEEKAKQLEAEVLEAPHEQEPNQQSCPTSDGGCDYALADLIINQISLEQQNIVTDPLLNAWKDENGYEDTDECRYFFAPTIGGSATANPETAAGSLFNQELAGQDFYLNDAYNYASVMLNYPGVPCLIGTSLEPKFTAPSPVGYDETVGFNGMESDVSLNAQMNYSASGSPQANYATFTWNFGDGTPEVSGYAPGTPTCESPWLSPCAASVYHIFQYGGTYEVTLTVRDVAGDTASVSHLVSVAGPPRPGSSGSGSGGSGSGSSGGSGSSPGSQSAPKSPVAAALIVPQSLRTAARKGLTVYYSVNEQVAGNFEVLLNRALAHKLGISGSLAAGLPAGSAPELVIAKAILVTTKGGHNAVHIQFSKRTAARLAHAHKVPLTLRLVVRNTSAGTTSVVTSLTLNA